MELSNKICILLKVKNLLQQKGICDNNDRQWNHIWHHLIVIQAQ